MLPSDIEDALCLIAPRFPTDTCWAVSCGAALALHGLNYRPNDLDLFAGQADATRLALALADLPVLFPYCLRESREFSSHWGRYMANGVEVDVVGNFSVRRDGHMSTWDTRHPCWSRLDRIPLRALTVPVFSLHDLLALYEALPDEDVKLGLIRARLDHGVRCRL